MNYKEMTTEELQKQLKWWKRECELMMTANGRERVRCKNQVKKIKKELEKRSN